MANKSFAPIALFVYNRLDHAQNTLSALALNVLARESDLFIFSDGPKNSDAAKAVNDVRAYIKGVTGFRSISIIERTENLGLAKSLIAGISEICDKYGRVIVVEDDIVTTPHFLEFMNDSLDRYVNDDKVMHISGYMFPVRNPEKIPETFFFRASSCWGWATWKRAWKKFQPDSSLLISRIDALGARNSFNLDGTMDYYAMLESQRDGKINSWAVRWYASVFLEQGLCLHPRNSLVNNVGHDGSGVHCDTSTIYEVSINSKKINSFPAEFSESSVALKQVKAFNRSFGPTLLSRIKVKLLSLVRSA